MREKLYILLPVHNRCEITKRFIECLKVQTFQGFHLVLIDDGSSDSTVEMVSNNINSLTIITGKGDWWWAGSLQQGYRWLQGQRTQASDIILIINDDTEFGIDFLSNALTLLQKKERTLLLAQCYCRLTGMLLDGGVHVDWKNFSFKQAKTPEEINCFSTRGLFMRVSDFFEIGGFYPILLPHYTSDYEFTLRAHRLEMNLVTDPSCKLKMDQSTTGFHDIYYGSVLISLKRLFSIKSTHNPLVLTAFIALSCPYRYMLRNLYRVLSTFLITVYKIVRINVS
jgi:GT2 family glycosyltransferase